MLKNVKAVLFDLDGTLIDSMWVWRKIDEEYLGRYGLSSSPELQTAISGKSFRETAEYFKEYFPIPDSIEDMMDTWNRMALDKYKNEVMLKPGAFQFLEFLKENGIKTAICTSNSSFLTNIILSSHDIEQMFDTVLTADMKFKGKPSPEIYLKASELLEVKSEDCLVFEDILMGVLAGKNAGMRVCAVEDIGSEHEREDILDAADYMIKDYMELL